MSHENLLTGHNASETLRELRAETEGLEQIAERAGEEIFHETGSTPVIRGKDSHTPSWSREDYDPLTSPYVMVESAWDRQQAERQRRQATAEPAPLTESDHQDYH